MLDIAQVSDGYEVKFAYRPFLVDAIKKIPGAKFNYSKKYWHVPEDSGQALLNWASNFKASVTQSPAAVHIGEIEPLPELQVPIPDWFYNREKKAKGLPCEVMAYQKNGVAYTLEHERTIIGDQPGLGKTAQAILAAILSGSRCILVISPATLKDNWRREWKSWADRNALIMSDRIKTSWPQYYQVGMCSVFICNYESLKKYFVDKIDKHYDKNGKEKPLRLNHIHFKDTIDLFDTVIVDEVHRCKDGKTQTAKFVMGITKGKKHVYALTGTPVVNKPIDLIPQLYIIGQLDHFGGYKGFVDRYCQGTRQASNLKELNYLLHKHCFYRREKSEVLKDLPAKMRNIIRVDIPNRDEYNKAETRLKDYLRENLNKSQGEITRALRGETMVLIGILKKISAKGKIEHVIEHIREVVEAGEKIVVFAWHKDMVHEMKQAVPGAVTIVGDDSLEERQRAVDAFQNDPQTQVIICNIKSGGVGITLTASSRVIFLELPWHPADCEQCEDRCHRIGQVDSVECGYFLGHDTIDEYIYDIIDKKRSIVKDVTGSEEEVETAVFDEFINLFTKEKL